MSITRTIVSAQPGYSVVSGVLGDPGRPLRNDDLDDLDEDELRRRLSSWAGLWDVFRRLLRRRKRRAEAPFAGTREEAKAAFHKALGQLTVTGLSHDTIIAWMVTHQDGKVIDVTPITVDARPGFRFDGKKHAISGPDFVYFPPTNPEGGGSYMIQGAGMHEVIKEFRERFNDEREKRAAEKAAKPSATLLSITPKEAS
jgi:hypothetical protein